MDIGLKLALTGLIPAVLGFVLGVIATIRLENDKTLENHNMQQIGIWIFILCSTVFLIGLFIWIW